MKIGDLVYYESKFRIRQGVGIITGKGVSSFHWAVFQSDGETRHYTELELTVIA
jgi:hypothetical protein